MKYVSKRIKINVIGLNHNEVYAEVLHQLVIPRVTFEKTGTVEFEPQSEAVIRTKAKGGSRCKFQLTVYTATQHVIEIALVVANTDTNSQFFYAFHVNNAEDGKQL
jgi:hypothetical protein